MKIRLFFTLMGVITCIALSSAQTGNTLKGIVVETDDKGNITPIQGATVMWINTSIGTTTDSNGVFYIPTTDRTKRLVVGYVGFKTDTVFVPNLKYVRVVLISKNRLNEVDIVYQRKATEVSYLDPWKTTIMNEKELFKMACCNLAESFETNPSVDVAFTDAVTGTRQIQMLGLSSQYTQVTQEYVPSVRGLATNYGFTYTPGTWVNSIQVSKGVGSVVNGFESISGLINTELHKPDVKDKVYLNLYASEGGRYEVNLILAQKLGDKFSHSFMTHVSTINQRADHNHDGYLDNPLGDQWNVLYRWKLDAGKGIATQGGIRILRDVKMGGMLNFNNQLDTQSAAPMYGTRVVSERKDGWLKFGYTFSKKVYKSIGIQLAGSLQDFDSYFGFNTYTGKQQSLYGNFIYQSIIYSSDHKFRTGFSNQTDVYDETLFNYGMHAFNRKEIVSGGFFEYTFSRSEKFTAVGGIRQDYNSIFGWFTTPRLHIRYAPSTESVWRFSAGRGQRTANVIAENTGMLVSSRRFVFTPDSNRYAYGFKPEVAWNFGLNFTHEFKLNYRRGTFTLDYYYTDFINQVVVDRDANTQQVIFSNLSGTSTSNSFQAQVDYEIIRRLDMRLAYRFYDVKTQYQTGLLQVPLIAQNRAFVNLAYATKSKWSFDATWQWNGAKRLPSTTSNPDGKKLNAYSPSFSVVSTQITKAFKKPRLDIYVGMENIFNFKQLHPIIDGHHPYSAFFDASMVWGPLFGRMSYIGLRLKI